MNQKAQRAGEKPVNRGRHEYWCKVCKHPKREDIEREWIDWGSTAEIGAGRLPAGLSRVDELRLETAWSAKARLLRLGWCFTGRRKANHGRKNLLAKPS